jgi:uncharacterized protein
MRDYTQLHANPAWAAVQYLIADSHDHENYHLSLAPIADSDDHGTDDAALERMLTGYIDPALDFYDVFLKGERPVESLPRVQWHLGHVGHRQSATWPPTGAEVVRLFLADLGAAGSEGTLTWDEPAGSEEATWTYDPQDLVPSAVPNSFAFLHEYPDERRLADRADVLVFTSEPVTSAVDLAGPVDLHVAVSTDAPTTHLFAKLYDVDPDGAAHMVVRGQAELLETAGDRLLRIELGHTGYRFRTGHALRLIVTSSDFPEFVPHPGTAENPWLAVDTAPSTQTLRGGPGLAPYLALTVVHDDA